MNSSDYDAASAECGTLNPSTKVIHPHPPEGSRIDDIWVHFIDKPKLKKDVIQFWFSEKNIDIPFPVDYEILDATLTDEEAIFLIKEVFFLWMMDDRYRAKVTFFSFQNVKTKRTQDLAY